VCRSVQTFQAQAEQKGLALRSESESAHVFVDCDAHKMERVVMNLVGNAMKFTPDGGAIEVDVIAEEGSETVLLRVRDSGMGIPPEALARVTERYFTVGDQPSGSGLGLAICKEIVELHEGALEISSPAPGRDGGTEVRVRLPRAEPPEVLVVEDNADVREILVLQIEAQGYRVQQAENGVDAIACVQEDPPDLVMLDLALPEMDGTEVILRLKGDKKTMRIPVIVVTGAHVGSSKAQVLGNFGIPAMPKPWKEKDLLDRIEGAFLGRAAVDG
jgi:CheY-like chemotaxis protein/anti-sigma regulatory factor (Ser/Thr protein kinase)